jgi:hypothetical protein
MLMFGVNQGRGELAVSHSAVASSDQERTVRSESLGSRHCKDGMR